MTIRARFEKFLWLIVVLLLVNVVTSIVMTVKVSTLIGLLSQPDRPLPEDLREPEARQELFTEFKYVYNAQDWDEVWLFLGPTARY